MKAEFETTPQMAIGAVPTKTLSHAWPAHLAPSRVNNGVQVAHSITPQPNPALSDGLVAGSLATAR